MKRRVELRMDMNALIEQILNKEDNVVAINCIKGTEQAGISFERAQQSAGMIKDLTWDMSFNDGVPLISRKGGVLPDNFNYVVFEITFNHDGVARSYIENNGRRLTALLHKYKLGTYQGFAYVKNKKLYIMFNTVDTKGKRFGKIEDMKMSLAFR